MALGARLCLETLNSHSRYTRFKVKMRLNWIFIRQYGDLHHVLANPNFNYFRRFKKTRDMPKTAQFFRANDISRSFRHPLTTPRIFVCLQQYYACHPPAICMCSHSTPSAPRVLSVPGPGLSLVLKRHIEGRFVGKIAIPSNECIHNNNLNAKTFSELCAVCSVLARYNDTDGVTTVAE